MGSERVDVLPRQPQAVVMVGGAGGRVRVGGRLADPGVEQATVDQREQVVVEATHGAIQRGLGLPGEMALDAGEEVKHQGATVRRQRGVGAVEERVGQVGREGHQRVKGFWNQRQGDRIY